MTDTEQPSLAEQIIMLVLESGTHDDGGGTTYNVTVITEELVGVISFLNAGRPDLNTPQRRRLWSLMVAKRLAEQVADAQSDPALTPLFGAMTVQQMVAQ